MKKKILLINAIFTILVPFIVVNANKKPINQNSHQIQLTEVTDETTTENNNAVEINNETIDNNDENENEENPYAPLNDSRNSHEILVDDEYDIIKRYEKEYGPNQDEWPEDVREAMSNELLENRI